LSHVLFYRTHVVFYLITSSLHKCFAGIIISMTSIVAIFSV